MALPTLIAIGNAGLSTTSSDLPLFPLEVVLMPDVTTPDSPLARLDGTCQAGDSGNISHWRFDDGYTAFRSLLRAAGTAVFPGILTFCLDPAWIRVTTARDRAVVTEGVKRVVAAMRGM